MNDQPDEQAEDGLQRRLSMWSDDSDERERDQPDDQTPPNATSSERAAQAGHGDEELLHPVAGELGLGHEAARAGAR